MPTCAFLSFRLGLTDGVSVVAARWAEAFCRLGFEVVTVAGEGPVDRTVRGLELDAEHAPDADDLEGALFDADLVVVENLLTIPMNLPASRAAARVLAGRPALLHHHDPPWQRTRYREVTDLPVDDPAWRHVTINELTRREMQARGIRATTIYNGFDVHVDDGDRSRTRDELGVADDELLLVHPVRAIERKGVPTAVALAEALGATYWLTGPAEEDYAPTLDAVLGAATVRVIHAPVPKLPDVYAACDAVAFPSTWEGFGNPPVEASLHGRAVAVGNYPVVDELLALGFGWFPADDQAPLRAFLERPDPGLLRRNRSLVEQHLSVDAMQRRIAALLDEAGWAA